MIKNIFKIGKKTFIVDGNNNENQNISKEDLISYIDKNKEQIILAEELLLSYLKDNIFDEIMENDYLVEKVDSIAMKDQMDNEEKDEVYRKLIDHLLGISNMRNNLNFFDKDILQNFKDKIFDKYRKEILYSIYYTLE